MKDCKEENGKWIVFPRGGGIGGYHTEDEAYRAGLLMYGTRSGFVIAQVVPGSIAEEIGAAKAERKEKP